MQSTKGRQSGEERTEKEHFYTTPVHKELHHVPILRHPITATPAVTASGAPPGIKPSKARDEFTPHPGRPARSAM